MLFRSNQGHLLEFAPWKDEWFLFAFLRKRDGVPEPGILFSARRSPAAGTVWQQPADSLQIVPDPMYLCQDGRCSGVQKALSVFLTGMRQHVSGNRNNGRGKRGRPYRMACLRHRDHCPHRESVRRQNHLIPAYGFSMRTVISEIGRAHV